MAPRAYWKGFLRLSLVSCPIQLFPATSEREKISFNQINKETGNRVRYRKVDESTGEEVSADEIVKGYQVDKGRYVEINDEEIEAIALESTRTIEIDEFVPRSEIDDLYLIRPYYIVPDGKVGQDAFAVIRNVIKQMNMVAIGRVVLTSREHVIALEARGKGLMGTLLRYPYEVRDESEYFDDIQDVKLEQGHDGSCAAHRENQDRALRAGEVRGPLRDGAEGAGREEDEGHQDRSAARARRADQGHQPDGCTAPQRTLRAAQSGRKQTAKRGRKRIEGQKEMLFPISGKKAAKEVARKSTRASGRRKAG